MEATIKCLILRDNCAIVSQVEEVDVELGEPNCKLIKPCEVHKNGDSIYLTPVSYTHLTLPTILRV